MKELLLKKEELEKNFEIKKKQAQTLANDIVLLEQLFQKKNELNKLMTDIEEIGKEYTKVCEEIEGQKNMNEADDV